MTAGLDAAGVAWTRMKHLVRGLDYYRHTAFEFVTDRLGAQGTVLAGGRYDGLMESLGGAPTPAVGWAAGIERLAMLVGEAGEEPLSIALAVEDDALINVAIGIASDLWRDGFSVEVISSGSARKRYDKASKLEPEVLASVQTRDGQPGYSLRTSIESLRKDKIVSIFEKHIYV